MNTASSLVHKDVVKKKHRYGFLFGVVVGFGFALTSWGLDANIIHNVHGYQPWLKFVIGALLCMSVGGLAGWISARFEKTWLSVLLWLIAAAFFAWFSVANTFQIFPALIVKLDFRLAPMINYPVDIDVAARTSLAVLWTGIFGVIVGVLQLPLSEGAVFSPAFGSKLVPLVVAVVVIGICGIILDSLNNEPLRLPVISLYRTIDFAIETHGQNVDPAMARTNRRYAVRYIEDWLDRPYYLIVGSFDRELIQVHVLANFDGRWADCLVVYNQPSSCQPISE